MDSISTKLNSIRERINSIAQQNQRKAEDICLLAVSKTYPAEIILAAAYCGQRHFGENYLQEALDKIGELKTILATLAINFNTKNNINNINKNNNGVINNSGIKLDFDQFIWHFIGPIQRNKTKQIAENFQWVESLDRLVIAQRLSEQRPSHLPPLQVCVQVNIDAERSKSGCHPDQALALCQQILTLPNLQLRGLMAIPAETTDYQQQLASFSKLKQIFTQISDSGIKLDTLSLGMSNDFPAAIAAGSTQIRLGSAIFGQRQQKA